jgi:hypothetical protein
MRLLPIHDLPRLIFLDARDVTNLLILEWAEEPVSSAKCDTKVIMIASPAVPAHVDTAENPIYRNIFPSLRTAA